MDPDRFAPAGGPPYAINYFSASDLTNNVQVRSTLEVLRRKQRHQSA